MILSDNPSMNMHGLQVGQHVWSVSRMGDRILLREYQVTKIGNKNGTVTVEDVPTDPVNPHVGWRLPWTLIQDKARAERIYEKRKARQERERAASATGHLSV